MMATGGDSFISELSNLLDQEDADAVTQFFDDEQRRAQLVDRAWDALGYLTAHVSDDAKPRDEAFHRICDYLVRYLASQVKPKEFLVMALEQIEQFKTDAKFRLFLDPLKTALLRIGLEKYHSVDFVLGALYAHISSSRVTAASLWEQNGTWEQEKELAFLHNDATVQRLNGLASDYVAFIEDLVIAGRNSAWATWAVGGYRKNVMRHVVAVLEWPLVYTDFVTGAYAISDAPPTQAFHIVRRAFAVCVELSHYNVFDFITAALIQEEVADLSKQAAEEEEEKDEEEKEEAEEKEEELGKEDTRYSAKGLLVLLHCVYSPCAILPDACPSLPQVFSPLHSLHFCLPFLLAVLEPKDSMQRPETLVARTALSLLRQLLARIPRNSLPAATLDEANTGRLIARLIAIVTFHECRLVRHLAIRCLDSWFWAMAPRGGKQQLFQTVWRRSSHAGLRGHFVGLVKDHVHRILSTAGAPDCDFFGATMPPLLRTMAALPHGATTDLLEQQDCLLPLLNFLLYLTLSDRQNRTGLWSVMPWLESNLFEPMRIGLNMSRAHYQRRIDTIDEDAMEACLAGTEVTVSGVALPEMTRDEKLDVYRTALVRFDLLESVLGQLTSAVCSRRPQLASPSQADASIRATVSEVVA